MVLRLDVEDELRAREIVEIYDDRDFSLTGATSFAVMERLGLATAFFDRHLVQYGLRSLGLEGERSPLPVQCRRPTGTFLP